MVSRRILASASKIGISASLLLVAPTLIYAALQFTHQFRQSGGCFFERGGQGWELIVSLMFGVTITCLLFSIAKLAHEWFDKRALKHSLLLSTVLCSMVLFLLNLNGQFFLDKFVAACGIPLSHIVRTDTVRDELLPSTSAGVIAPNSELRFQTKSGSIVIKAGKGCLRTIRWSNGERALVVRPYESDGKKGLTNSRPCEGWPGFDWPSCDNIYQCFYEETTLELADAAALQQVFRDTDDLIPSILTKDKLVLGWGIDRFRPHTINIVIIKCLIHKPGR